MQRGGHVTHLAAHRNFRCSPRVTCPLNFASVYEVRLALVLFASHWLKVLNEILKLISERSDCSRVIAFDSRWKTASSGYPVSLT